MRKAIIPIFLFALAVPGYAQGLFETAGVPAEKTPSKLEWSGYVRGSAYGGGEQFDYASLFGEASLQGKYALGKTFLFADIRLREGLQFGEVGPTLQLKEVYAGYQSEKLDLYLGNQIVTWGRTDGFNPTNCITPRDYFFLTSEPDDQTLPNFMLRAKYHLSPALYLEGIAIPYFRPSVYRYDLFDMGDNAHFEQAEWPEKSFRNGALAARLNGEFSRIGFSLSYFNGYDPFYGFGIQSVDMTQFMDPQIAYQPAFFRKHALGADFALPLGAWIARGELAWKWTQGYDTLMYVPHPGLSYVLGIERNFWDITVLAQYIGQYTHNFQEIREPVLENPLDPVALFAYIQARIDYESTLFNRKIFQQQEPTNHALFLSLSRAFAHEALRAELSGYYNITSEEYLVRPRLSWKITDALTTAVGAQIMGGPKASIFDYSKSVLNGAFAELKVNF
ncbi:MAG: hypothetical protein H6563_03825 [Lewinellaceae bacterium]|nr:hypothetical protein [Lewinellaceae bacterium]